MGRTQYLQDIVAPFQISAQTSMTRLKLETLCISDGAVALDGRVWGTYIHGILHNDDFRRAWLNRIRTHKGLSPNREGFVLRNAEKLLLIDWLST